MAAALPPGSPAWPRDNGVPSRCTGRDTVFDEDASTGYAGNGPQVMAALPIDISLLHLAGITQITRTLQAITRDRNRVLAVLPL